MTDRPSKGDPAMAKAVTLKTEGGPLRTATSRRFVVVDVKPPRPTVEYRTDDRGRALKRRLMFPTRCRVYDTVTKEMIA